MLCLAQLQAGRLEGYDGGLVAHVTETLRQRLVLRTQIGQADAIVAGTPQALVIKGALRLGATQGAQSAKDSN